MQQLLRSIVMNNFSRFGTIPCFIGYMYYTVVVLFYYQEQSKQKVLRGLTCMLVMSFALVIYLVNTSFKDRLS